MKVLYITRPSFLDYDLSFINSMKNRVDLYTLIDINPGKIKSTILKLEDERHGVCGIIDANGIKELEAYSAMLDMNNTRIINRTTKRNRIVDIVHFNLKLYKYIREIKPNIIHCNDILDYKYILILLLYKKIIVQTIHDPVKHSSDVYSINQKIQIKINYKMISNYILLNNVYIDEFKKQIGKTKRIKCVKIGIYEYIKKHTQYDKETTDNLYGKYILFFGRIQEYKGIQYLIKAFTKMLSKHDDLKLLIAGEGKIWFDIPENIRENIVIINRYLDVQEMAKYIRESLVVACPYLDATQSGVIMTALALNKPVVATDVGSIREILIDKKMGYIVKPKNDEELEAALNEIVSDITIREKMTKYIEAHYKIKENTWDAITENIKNLYINVIKK